MEQLKIKFVPSMDMTKLYSFVTHHSCCSLAYSIKISLVPQDQYSLNINTTSSQLLDPTYYKRAIIEQTLTIFNKTFLNFQSLHCNVFFYFLNVFYFVYNVKPFQGSLVQNRTFSFKKNIVILSET